MANLGVVVTLTGRDLASGAIGSVIGSLGGLGRAANEVNGTLSSIGRAIQSGIGFGAGLALIRGFGSVMEGAQRATMGLNMTLEGAHIAFTSFIQDAQKAAAFISQLQTFAATTPFEFPDLLMAARRMMALGFQAEQVLPLLTSIGNVMSAAGQISTDAVNGVVLAMIQVASKGRLAAQEINQFAERGIPVFEMLQQRFGWTRAEILKLGEAGRITAADFFAAWQQYAAGPRFEGAMYKMSQTFEGALNNIKDGMSLLLSGTFQPFYNRIRDVTVAVANFLVTPQMRTFAESWRKTFEEILSGFSRVEEAFKRAFEAFSLGNTAEGFNQLIVAVNELGSKMFGAAWTVATEFARGLLEAGTTVIRDAARGVAEIVASFLGHSLPDEAPLANIASGGTSVGEAWAEGLEKALENRMKPIAENVAAFFERVNASITIEGGRQSLEAARGNMEALNGVLDQVENSMEAIDDNLREWQNQSQDIKMEIQDIKAAYDDLTEPLEEQRSLLQDQIDAAHEYAEAIIEPLQEQVDLLDLAIDQNERYVDSLKNARDWAYEQATIQDDILSTQLKLARLQAMGDPRRRAELAGQLEDLRLQQRRVRLEDQRARLREREKEAKESDRDGPTEGQLKALELEFRELDIQEQIAALENRPRLAEIAQQEAILGARKEQRDLTHQLVTLENALQAIPAEQRLEVLKSARQVLLDQIKKAKKEEEAQVKPLEKQLDIVEKQIKALEKEEKTRIDDLQEQADILDRQIALVQRQRREYQDLQQDIKAAINIIKEQEAAAKAAAKAAQEDQLKNAPTIGELPLERKEIEDTVGEAARAAARSFVKEVEETIKRLAPVAAVSIAGYIFGEAFLGFLGPLAGPAGALFMNELVKSIREKVPGFDQAVGRIFTNAITGLGNLFRFLASGNVEDLAKFGANVANIVPKEAIPGILNFTQAVRNLGVALFGTLQQGLVVFFQALRGDWSPPEGALDWVDPFVLALGTLGTTAREVFLWFVNDGWPAIKTAGETVMNWFESNALPKFKEFAVQMATFFGEPIYDDTTPLNQQGQTAFQRTMAEMGTTLQNLQGPLNIAWNEIKNFGAALRDDLLPELRIFVENLGTPAAGVLGLIGANAATADEKVRLLAGALGILNDRADILGVLLGTAGLAIAILKFTGLVSRLIIGFWGLAGSIGAALTLAPELAAFFGVGGAIAGGIAFLVTLLIGFGIAWAFNWFDIRDTTSRVLNEIWTEIQRIGGEIVNNFKEAGRLIWESFTKDMEDLGTFVTEWATKFKDGLLGFWPAVVENWNTFAEEMYNSFMQDMENIKKFWDEWSGRIKSAWDTWVEELRQTLLNWATEALKVWNQFATDLETAVGTFITNIKTKWEEFWQNFPNVVRNGVGKVLEALQILKQFFFPYGIGPRQSSSGGISNISYINGLGGRGGIEAVVPGGRGTATAGGTHGGHPAIDIFAAAGTPIRAPVGGTSRPAVYSLGGNATILEGDDGKWYYFAHALDPMRAGRVEAGDVIGSVGNTGNARGTAPHLHFAAATSPDVFGRLNGSGDLDPEEVLNALGISPPVGMIAQNNMAAWMQRAFEHAVAVGLPDPVQFVAQIMQESRFDPNAVSRAGARGIAQFMPGTGNAVARQMGLSQEEFWSNPDLQLQGAAQHMADLTRQFGSQTRAMSAYFSGTGGGEHPDYVRAVEQWRRTVEEMLQVNERFQLSVAGGMGEIVEDTGASVMKAREFTEQMLNLSGTSEEVWTNMSQQVTNFASLMSQDIDASATTAQDAMMRIAGAVQPIENAVANGRISMGTLQSTLIEMAARAGLAEEPFNNLTNSIGGASENMSYLISRMAPLGPAFEELHQKLSAQQLTMDEATLQLLQLMLGYQGIPKAVDPSVEAINDMANTQQNAANATSTLIGDLSTLAANGELLSQANVNLGLVNQAFGATQAAVTPVNESLAHLNDLVRQMNELLTASNGLVVEYNRLIGEMSTDKLREQESAWKDVASKVKDAVEQAREYQSVAGGGEGGDEGGGIPTFHSGGRVPGMLGEDVLALLQAGETVLTPRQTSQLERMLSTPSSSPTSAVRAGSEDEERLTRIIAQAVSQAIGKPIQFNGYASDEVVRIVATENRRSRWLSGSGRLR